jgi:hypothetical protein
MPFSLVINPGYAQEFVYLRSSDATSLLYVNNYGNLLSFRPGSGDDRYVATVNLKPRIIRSLELAAERKIGELA